MSLLVLPAFRPPASHTHSHSHPYLRTHRFQINLCSRPAQPSPPDVHTWSLSNCALTPRLLPRAPCFPADHPLLSPSSLSLVSSEAAEKTKTLTPPHLTSKGFGASFLFSLSLSLLFLFVCFVFLCSFIRFILFIPSKLPEQLMMSDKSGTFALFTFPSKTEDTGRRKSKGTASPRS